MILQCTLLFNCTFQSNLVRTKAFVKLAADKQVIRTTNDRCFVYVNHRPVDYPYVEKMINKHVRKFLSVDGKKYPFVFLHINAPPHEMDRTLSLFLHSFIAENFTPNKRCVKFHNEDMLLKLMDELLNSHLPLPVAMDSDAKYQYLTH